MTTATLTLPNADAKRIARQLTPAVNTRSKLPALGGVRITIDDDGAYRFDGTDLELALSIGSANGGGQSFVVPFKMFKAVVGKLPKSGDVTIDSDGNVGPAKLRTLPVEDFPDISAHAEGYVAWHLDAQAFMEAFMSVAKAAHKDEARPVLTGVRFELSASGLTSALHLVATDSYRMHWETVADTDSPAGFSDVSFIVPARVAAALSKLVTKSSETITISIPTNGSPERVCFTVDGTRLYSRLIQGEFPNYRQLIPAQPPYVIEGDSDSFAETVARVGQLAVKGAPVKLVCSADGVVATAASQDVGEASEKIPGVTYSGDPLTIAYNPTFLLGCVAHVGLPIRFNDGLKPSVLGAAPPDRGALVMPVRV